LSEATWTTADRPAWLRIANAVGRGLEQIGVGPLALDADSLLAQARQRTGLDDFGNEAFLEPLRVLTRAFEEEAHFTPVGRWLAREEVRNHLEGRLRILDTLRRQPEILEQRIERPIFITGPGRSGTSILHQVLSEDPELRGLLHWEALYPCPPPEPATHASDPRIAKGDREVWRWEKIAPRYKAMHEGGGAVPQEDDFLYDFEFLSDHLGGLYDVPSFSGWLARVDRRRAFEMHRDVLKILQWKIPTKQWVLKSPTHMANLEPLFAVYPDALVVQTHRDPLKVVASMASLRTTLYWMRSDRVDPLAMAKTSAQGIQLMLDRVAQLRDAGVAPPEQFADMQFHEFTSDPIGVVRQVYERFDMVLSAVAAERMLAYLEAKPRDRGHGLHRYSLEGMGLDPEALRAQYAAYQKRYDVPSES
jgi:hypothetical protein